MMTDGVRALVALQNEGDGLIGAARIGLLEAIRKTGSISAAATALKISYRSAWDSVHSLNNLFGDPLVTAKPGGSKGGSASLTAAGETVIQAFHAMQAELELSMDRLQQLLDGAKGPSFSELAWGLNMKTSARNILHCKVANVLPGSVNCEIALEFGGAAPLIAMISHHSAQHLKLVEGAAVYALINPSFVILAREDEMGRTSARNCLRGTVMQREDGTVNSELVIAIGDSKTIVASITRESARDLNLQVGDRACALIKASHVILVTPN